MNCQKEHTTGLVDQAMSYGIAAVKNRTSQTFLNFFDVYSVVDQKSLASSQRSDVPSF